VIMFVVFVRLTVSLGAVAFALFGGLFWLVLGETNRATGLALFALFVAWMVRPDAEEMAAFHEFQKQRAERLNIKL